MTAFRSQFFAVFVLFVSFVVSGKYDSLGTISQLAAISSTLI